MFIWHRPKAWKSPARVNGQAVPILPVVLPSVQVAKLIATIEDDDATDHKKVVNKYLDRLETLMEKYMDATVLMNMHIKLSREQFRAVKQGQNIERYLARIRNESDQ